MLFADLAGPASASVHYDDCCVGAFDDPGGPARSAPRACSTALDNPQTVTYGE